MRTVIGSTHCIAAFLLLSTGAIALAQQTTPPRDTILPGTTNRIRVHRTRVDATPVIGRLQAIGDDSILIRPDADSSVLIALSRNDIARMEIERDAGTRDQVVATMAVIGTVAGGTAAVVHCVNNRSACAAEAQETLRAAENDSTYWGPSLLLTFGGTLAGALLGYALAPSPHWDVFALPVRTSGPDGAMHWGMRLGMRYQLGARPRAARRS